MVFSPWCLLCCVPPTSSNPLSLLRTSPIPTSNGRQYDVKKSWLPGHLANWSYCLDDSCTGGEGIIYDGNARRRSCSMTRHCWNGGKISASETNEFRRSWISENAILPSEGWSYNGGGHDSDNNKRNIAVQSHSLSTRGATLRTIIGMSHPLVIVEAQSLQGGGNSSTIGRTEDKWASIRVHTYDIRVGGNGVNWIQEES